MKYYLLSKAQKFNRFFDSLKELDAYIQAKTGARFFGMDFLKAHLQENNYYSYLYCGIDIAIYKSSIRDKVNKTTVQSDTDPNEAVWL